MKCFVSTKDGANIFFRVRRAQKKTSLPKFNTLPGIKRRKIRKLPLFFLAIPQKTR